MQEKQFVRIIAAAFSVITAGSSGASGFQLLEQNASGLGNAYAGSAVVAENASTIFFNPAGMTKLKNRELSAGLNIVKPSFEFENISSSNAPAALGSNGGDAGDYAFIPNGYISWGINKDLFVGLGLSAPFGLKTEYSDDWIGRFQATLFDIKTYNLNPSVAYRINDKFSVGAGLNWMYMDARYERYAAVANAVTQATKITLDASDDSFGWNIGMIFSAGPSTDIGFSYRSQIDQDLTGDISSTNQAVLPNGPASASLTLPDTYILSLKQKLNAQWEMLSDVSYTGWSSIGNVDIKRAGVTVQTLAADFEDTWRFALGATQQYSPDWRIKYGLAYDNTPVKNASSRLVSLPDNDRIWLSLGAQWKPDNYSALDFGLAYLIVKDSIIDNNQSLQGRGRVTGTYDGSVIILGAQYSKSF
jgi:long-chain fatty acid transport protein